MASELIKSCTQALLNACKTYSTDQESAEAYCERHANFWESKYLGDGRVKGIVLAADLLRLYGKESVCGHIIAAKKPEQKEWPSCELEPEAIKNPSLDEVIAPQRDDRLPDIPTTTFAEIMLLAAVYLIMGMMPIARLTTMALPIQLEKVI